MHKLKNLAILVLFLGAIASCTSEYEEEIQSIEVEQSISDGLSMRSVKEINNPSLTENLTKTIENAKGILSKEFTNYLSKHNVNDIYFDVDNVLEGNHSEGVTSYTFFVNIANKKGNGENEMISYLTMTFDKMNNLNSSIELGGGQIVYFGTDGDILKKETQNNVRGGGYGDYDKPSNKASKAPKSVVCNWASSTGNLGLLNGYCGYSVGIGGPPPISVLAGLFPEWYVYSNGQWIELDFPRSIIPLTSEFNDLYLLGSTGSTYPIFNLNYHPNFSQLYNEIVNYYNQVYVIQLGYAITNPYTMTYDEDHIHKQAFIDSFMQWTYNMQNNYPSHYSYLTSNQSVYYQIFNLFAEYNSNNAVNDFLYLGQPWYIVQYSPNDDVRCLNLGSDYLLTSAGLTLMQQLGSGAITIEQFRAALPNCN
jgi:hypothetical protein